MDRFRKQAERFGARFHSSVVERVKKVDDNLKVDSGGKIFEARALVIATGAQDKRLTIPSEKNFYDKGVSGCATFDGFFYKNKKVIVVGGGNTALQDALFLTSFASKVTVVHRRRYLRADPIEVQKAKNNAQI